MEIYRTTKDINKNRPSALALGFFDGLHLGHTTLLDKCIEFARERGYSADVFTFRDHPKNVLSGEMLVPRIITESEKLLKLSALGIDRVFDFDFTESFHKMPPEEFARDLLAEAFAVKAVFCGFNFRFGADASGTPATLKDLGNTYDFETHVIEPVCVGDNLVSSSLIRSCINSGDVGSASSLLGREYSLGGSVQMGRRLGRILGFPTANIVPDKSLTLPANGVYITETLVGGVLYPSISNIGVRPTINDLGSVSIETHLLDFDGDLYGSYLSVQFKTMIREERHFENEEHLRRQIAIDTEKARQFFST